jgi:ABC-type glycerol-3-phosphate transport system substrate-binding protein
MTHVLVAVEKNISIAMENKNLVMKGIVQLLILLTCVLCADSASAQLNLVEDKEISELLELYKETNKQSQVIRAWRIQIITTDDRITMEESIKKFEELYPDVKYSWQHNPPYYQVRIGAYEKREYLEAFLLKLKEDFQAAIPVKDDIQKAEIIYGQ